MVVIMNSIESIMKTSAFNGTAKEMQLRMVMSIIRKAADEGESGISIPMYKMSALHMPTVEHEILEPSGFQTNEFQEETGVKKLHISWQ